MKNKKSLKSKKKVQSIKASKRIIPIEEAKQKLTKMYNSNYVKPKRRITIKDFDQDVYKKMKEFEVNKKSKLDEKRKEQDSLIMQLNPKKKKTDKKKKIFLTVKLKFYKMRHF